MDLEIIAEKIDNLEHRLINFEEYITQNMVTKKEYHDDVQDAFAVLDHIAVTVDKLYSDGKRVNIL